MGHDELTIEILEDGTIKIDSGGVSPQNHMTAEALMRNFASVGGGKQSRRHKHGVVGAAVHSVQHVIGRAHRH